MIAKFIKRALRQLGVDVRRYAPQSSYGAQMGKLFANYHVDCVFDVGANTGQYAYELRQMGYRGRIVSFEPQSKAHSVLLRNSHNDPMWTVAPAMALGDFNGYTDINVAANSVSSSILRMSITHESAAPASKYIGKEKIKVHRLDSVFSEYVSCATHLVLKIDTQGYESKVLDGAVGCLERFIGVQAEMSLVELYEGQELFLDLAQRLCGKGFHLVGLFPGFTDNGTGHMLQVDGLFFRVDGIN